MGKIYPKKSNKYPKWWYCSLKNLALIRTISFLALDMHPKQVLVLMFDGWTYHLGIHVLPCLSFRKRRKKRILWKHKQMWEWMKDNLIKEVKQLFEFCLLYHSRSDKNWTALSQSKTVGCVVAKFVQFLIWIINNHSHESKVLCKWLLKKCATIAIITSTNSQLLLEEYLIK